MRNICSSYFEAILFAGFLRIGEVVQPGISHHTLVVNVIYLDYIQNIINVTINSPKTSKLQRILKKLFDHFRRCSKGQLFIHVNHRRVAHFQVCSILISVLQLAWYDPDQYNTHSNRFGAATTAVILVYVR